MARRAPARRAQHAWPSVYIYLQLAADLATALEPRSELLSIDQAPPRLYDHHASTPAVPGHGALKGERFETVEAVGQQNPGCQKEMK